MPVGYSLHIGLNAVDPAGYGGWSGDLGGCEPDARAMAKLAKSCGYREIRSLLTKNATSVAVLAAISRLAGKAQAGDAVLITYSGHGSQIPDVNGDEDEPDGEDETWCLFDRQVIDDELYALYATFRAGVRIFVLSDSCHSGTVARALPPALRAAMVKGGRDIPTVYKDTKRPLTYRFASEKASQVNYEKNRNHLESVQYIVSPRVTGSIAASLLLISGCQDNQLSADLGTNGLFTLRLLQARKAAGVKASFRKVHKKLLEMMPPDQTPNLMTLGANGSSLRNHAAFRI